MNIIKKLFSLGLSKQRALEIQQNPKFAPKSVRFGVVSIIYMVISIFLSFFTFFIRFFVCGVALDILYYLIGIIAGVLFPILMIFNSLNFFFTQIRINQNWATWLSLSVFIIGSVACVIIMLFGFNVL